MMPRLRLVPMVVIAMGALFLVKADALWGAWRGAGVVAPARAADPPAAAPPARPAPSPTATAQPVAAAAPDPTTQAERALLEQLRAEALLPLASRIRVRLLLAPRTPEDLRAHPRSHGGAEGGSDGGG